MMSRMYLMGILLFVFSWDAMAQVSPDEVWPIGQLRIWVSNPNGPGDRWNGDTATGVAGHPEIAQTDPLYKKLASLFSKKSGIVLEKKPPLLPYGKLVWWDIDNDGTKDIVFAGFIEKKDKPALYNLAELFIYPSFFEGFGFPPLEAMACGTPAIVSNTTSLPEIAGEAALMVDPYNVNEIAMMMKRVLTEEGLRRQMKDSGLALFKKFSWENCAEQTLKTLTEI